MTNKTIILGAGVTGLSAGIDTGWTIYEINDTPGGVCVSYYLNSDTKRSYCSQNNSYRFELGGGHWIFGADRSVLEFVNSLSPVKTYQRKSAVYFPEWDLYVPYPMQNHLSCLPKDVAQKALQEIIQSDHTKDVSTLADWLDLHFGKTLCELFFFPFHNLYTAGFFARIEPQDKYKTPVNKKQIMMGFEGETIPVGYNAEFVYPRRGLDDLTRKMADCCDVNYKKEAVKIDTRKKEIQFADGEEAKYDKLISTLPLNKAVRLAGMALDEKEAPYTSVLVVNIGARIGSKCPKYHWLYIPKSKAAFHRVGFYSNVDSSFLPQSLNDDGNRVSIYVEKAYQGGKKPSDGEIKEVCSDVVGELREWKFIDEAEVIDPVWIETAYTWSYPGLNWRENAVKALGEKGIIQTGRYGLWKFQGIAQSIKNGLEIGHGQAENHLCGGRHI